MSHSKTTTLLMMALAACAGDFNPVLGSGMVAGTDPTMDPYPQDSSSSEGDSGESDNGSDNGEEMSSSGSSGDPLSEDGESSTGEPGQNNPGPNEPCDPILAFEGIAPCEDPTNLSITYTCAVVQLMPDPGVTLYEFRCVSARDNQADGWGLGDSCSDDGGGEAGTLLSSGCLNAWCLWNGLDTNPATDPPWGHPEGACPFQPGGPEGPYSQGCCVPYCDDSHPCEPGWACVKNTPGTVPSNDFGACVWM